LNLCYLEEDIPVATEWNFFATLYVKSLCNVIGERVKSFVVHASLQATEINHILTPEDLYGLQKILHELHFSTQHRNKNTCSKLNWRG
jgi:hypothetical protein